MSFYGNIANTARTHFQFDRIYTSRFAMETAKNNDGIYAGRFVLVEYDNEANLDTFLRVQIKEELTTSSGDKVYTFYYTLDDNPNQSLALMAEDVDDGQIVYTAIENFDPANEITPRDCVFYIQTTVDLNTNGVATFRAIMDGEIVSNYTTNYNIDKLEYGRGYDSTVWQKVYVNNEEKYIKIAELNTVVPAFDVTSDAPTLMPILPHFDLTSTDLYYKLHWQPNWGLRVKSAEQMAGPSFQLDENGNTIEDENIYYSTSEDFIQKSNENTTWIRENYNPQTGETVIKYWNAENHEWIDSPTDFAAAIYYNKEGFSPSTISIERDIQDKINIETTGLSGNQYSTNDGLIAPQVDTQELSIILPSIGNSIAEMWNVVYGDSIVNGGNNRNMDIDWDSTNGLRLITTNNNGNGFTYNINQVSTLAGAINSVHDLMGMIIVDDNQSIISPENADDNKIYYRNNEYYRKAIGFESIELTDSQIANLANNSYVPINFNEFLSNKYFYKNEYSASEINYTLEENDYAAVNRVYYTNADSPGDSIFNAVTPIEFNNNWYKRVQTETPLNNLTEEEYEKNKYYIKDDNDQFVISDGDYSETETYYNVLLEYHTEENAADRETYYRPYTRRVHEGQIPYEHNKYVIYREGERIPDDFTAENFIDIKTCRKDNYIFNDAHQHYEIVSGADGSVELNPVDLFLITENDYYRVIDNNITYLRRCQYNTIPSIDEEIVYLSIDPFEEDDICSDFYSKERYYVTADNKIYSLDKGPFAENIQYYRLLESEKIQVVTGYYVSHTYYYKDNNDFYILSTDLKPVNGRDYYRKQSVYVLSDTSGKFPPGTEWNTNIAVPDTIKLAYRTPKSEFRKLEGFARTLNTIHGLILKINEKLLANDMITRDNNTVQGAINMLNDIIYKFEIIEAGQIMMVDDYGRIHSTPINGDDNWIDVSINSDITAPSINISHKYTRDNVNNTATNPNEEDIDSINLETITIDDTGHVTAIHQNTFTLPYGFNKVEIISPSDAQPRSSTMEGDLGNADIGNILNPSIEATSYNDSLKIAKKGTDITLTAIEEKNCIEINHDTYLDKNSDEGIDNTYSLIYNDETNSISGTEYIRYVNKFTINNGHIVEIGFNKLNFNILKDKIKSLEDKIKNLEDKTKNLK